MGDHERRMPWPAFEAEWQKNVILLAFWSKTILAIGYYKIKKRKCVEGPLVARVEI